MHLQYNKSLIHRNRAGSYGVTFSFEIPPAEIYDGLLSDAEIAPLEQTESCHGNFAAIIIYTPANFLDVVYLSEYCSNALFVLRIIPKSIARGA